MQVNDASAGLHAQDGETHIGLVSAHVSGRLAGWVAQIQVRQVYKNWSDHPVECVYTFPLGWQSVLLGMRVELNGKSLAGTVKPQKVAEALYEKAIDNGDLPVMLERSGKDLYTANIGNILPGDEVVIALDYAQILKAEDGAIRFSLPTTVAPRYGNALAEGMKPHQVTEADPPSEQRLFLSLELSETLSRGTVHSPSHEIQIQRQGHGCALKLEGAAWLDRDFVLVMDRLGDMNFALAAPDPVHPGQATVLSGAVYRPEGRDTHQAVAIKVLVDCSGSMQGDSMAQAVDCLGWLFGQLGSADQVSFTRFGSRVVHEHGSLKPCTTLYRQRLKAAARRMDADLGGTEIGQALQEVIAIAPGAPEAGSKAVILLITDGDVWDIEDTIATVRASGQRIYAVGVGSAPAQSLLKDMADVTGGACELVTPRESMQQAVERQLLRMRQAHAVEQSVECDAPIVWQSKPATHAAAGGALMSWTQIQTPGDAADALCMVQTVHPKGLPTPCPVVWDNSLALSRIAAAMRLHDMAQAPERERLALDYQLVTRETHLILVHERAESDKADDLPQLHQVRPMLAAGWGGNGTVQNARAGQSVLRIANSSYSMSHSVPAVWRTARSNSAAQAGGMDDIEIPAFLRSSKSSASSTPPAKPAHPIVQKLKDMVSPSRQASQRMATVVTPKGSPDALKAVLRTKHPASGPVHQLLVSYNQLALTHTRFRSALAACLKVHRAPELHWLVTRHMPAAGSAAPIWAIFIQWASENLSIELDRHAQRLLRDFLSTVDSELQQAIGAELSELKKDAPASMNT